MRVPISVDLRYAGPVERSSSIRDAARRFAVSGQADAAGAGDGQRCPHRYGGHRPPVLEPDAADLRLLVETTPTLTLAELETALQRRSGVRAGLSTIHERAPPDRPAA
jgi:putative transposase